MDSAPLKVPGFGLPINYLPDGEYFPSAIIDVSHSYSLAQGDAVTVRELIMLHLMNIITDKPEWDSKVFRKDLIQKWSEEARKQDTMDITDKMLDYVSHFDNATYRSSVPIVELCCPYVLVLLATSLSISRPIDRSRLRIRL